jgi:hypothetical protein
MPDTSEDEFKDCEEADEFFDQPEEEQKSKSPPSLVTGSDEISPSKYNNAEAEQPQNDNDMNMMDAPDEEEITNNPYILSNTRAVGPYSFIDDR